MSRAAEQRAAFARIFPVFAPLFGGPMSQQQPLNFDAQHFDGATVVPRLDNARLSTHLEEVKRLTAGGDWWSLRELARMVGCTEAGVSARLRDLRKARFGGHTIERKRVAGGLWVYRRTS